MPACLVPWCLSVMPSRVWLPAALCLVVMPSRAYELQHQSKPECHTAHAYVLAYTPRPPLLVSHAAKRLYSSCLKCPVPVPGK